MLIIKVHQEYEEIKLQVICPECGKHILIGEDDAFCPMCWREIEQTNINAWTEYENNKNTTL
jgi:endogenous inhibitor of DNA gyrase (YacG/DUF329 family)